MSETEKVTIRLPKKYLEDINFLVEHDDFPSRSEAIRTAVRDMLYYRVELVAEKAKKMATKRREVQEAKALEEDIQEEYMKR